MAYKKIILFTFNFYAFSLLAKENQAWKILYFLQPNVSDFVVLGAGKKDGLKKGHLLDALRAFPGKESENMEFVTGKIKVLSVASKTSVGRVEKISDHQNSFKVMAGDRVKLSQSYFNKRVVILPEVSFFYKDLFLDPSANPKTFELSKKGERALAKKADIFGPVRLKRLLISAHTDSSGSLQKNLLESQRRAQVIRSYLIRNHGFFPERVVAVGKGESSIGTTKGRLIFIKALSN